MQELFFKVVNKGILTLQMCTCSTFDSLLPVVTIPACFLTLIIYLQFIDVVGSLASHIKLLGVTVDSHLYMFKQTKLVSQYCFYHISYTAVAIALTLISSRLDYANSVLYGSPAKNISAEGLECGSNSCNAKASTLCLQSIHSVNSTGCQFSGSSNYFQNHAHWPYLSRLLIPYHPSRVLRSFSSSHLLQVPRTNWIFGSRCFHAAAPTIWNSLSYSVHSPDSFNSFCRHLKTPFPSSF